MFTYSGTTSSGGSLSSSCLGLYIIPNSGSEGGLQHLMDDRKRKRMTSNRESARRSRLRKQKHLDDLTTQVSQLTKENNQIIYSVSITTQHYASVEAENSVLRAQVAELSYRLQALNEMIAFMFPPMDTCRAFEDDQYNGGGGGGNGGNGNGLVEFVDECLNNSLSYLYVNQPILASADTIQH